MGAGMGVGAISEEGALALAPHVEAIITALVRSRRSEVRNLAATRRVLALLIDTPALVTVLRPRLVHLPELAGFEGLERKLAEIRGGPRRVEDEIRAFLASKPRDRHYAEWTLQHLSAMLSRERDALVASFFGPRHEAVRRLLSDFLGALFSYCSPHHAPETRSAAGTCLGKLGAMDPFLFSSSAALDATAWAADVGNGPGATGAETSAEGHDAPEGGAVGAGGPTRRNAGQEDGGSGGIPEDERSTRRGGGAGGAGGGGGARVSLAGHASLPGKRGIIAGLETRGGGNLRSSTIGGGAAGAAAAGIASPALAPRTPGRKTALSRRTSTRGLPAEAREVELRMEKERHRTPASLMLGYLQPVIIEIHAELGRFQTPAQEEALLLALREIVDVNKAAAAFFSEKDLRYIYTMHT